MRASLETRMSARSKKSAPAATTTTAIVTSTEPEVLQPPVADEVVDQVVRELNQLDLTSKILLSIQMGKLIVDRFYGGNREAWFARGAADQSFRKLAQHEDLTVSASMLQRSCAIYELVTRLGVDVATWQHLSFSHVRVVLPLPADVQQKLLTKGEEQAWTVERITQEAEKHRTKRGGGRKALPAFVKTVNRFEKLLHDDDGRAFDGLDDIDEMDETEATRLYQAVTGMKLKCEALQKALEHKTPGFSRRDS